VVAGSSVEPMTRIGATAAAPRRPGGPAIG
jgi:hypothetical protein